MSGRIRTYIALQVRELRESNNLSQSDLAAKTGTHQSAISRLENTDYGRMSVQTLIDLATAMDVALVVKFASYEDFLFQHSDVRPSALSVESFSETYERCTNSTNQREFSDGQKRRISPFSNNNRMPRLPRYKVRLQNFTQSGSAEALTRVPVRQTVLSSTHINTPPNFGDIGTGQSVGVVA